MGPRGMIALDRTRLNGWLLSRFIGKKSPAALFSDIGFGSGGKKRGFCRLARRVATPWRPTAAVVEPFVSSSFGIQHLWFYTTV